MGLPSRPMRLLTLPRPFSSSSSSSCSMGISRITRLDANLLPKHKSFTSQLILLFWKNATSPYFRDSFTCTTAFVRTSTWIPRSCSKWVSRELQRPEKKSIPPKSPPYKQQCRPTKHSTTHRMAISCDLTALWPTEVAVAAEGIGAHHTGKGGMVAVGRRENSPAAGEKQEADSTLWIGGTLHGSRRKRPLGNRSRMPARSGRGGRQRCRAACRCGSGRRRPRGGRRRGMAVPLGGGVASLRNSCVCQITRILLMIVCVFLKKSQLTFILAHNVVI
jgi:hypothetical protein